MVTTTEQQGLVQSAKYIHELEYITGLKKKSSHRFDAIDLLMRCQPGRSN